MKSVQSGSKDAVLPSNLNWATAAAAFGGITLLILAILHVLSPEFDPSWRMVSEYANGRYRWALSAMFLSWAISSWLLAWALFPLARTFPAKLGVGILCIVGVGEAMAAAFDINHPLHTHAAILGVGGLPIAAMLIGISFGRLGHWKQSRALILWLSNLTWISVGLMSVAMAIFFTTLSRAGVDLSATSKPLSALPEGVVALGGWANRFLVLIYCLWAITVALRIRKSNSDAQLQGGS